MTERRKAYRFVHTVTATGLFEAAGYAALIYAIQQTGKSNVFNAYVVMQVFVVLAPNIIQAGMYYQARATCLPASPPASNAALRRCLFVKPGGCPVLSCPALLCPAPTPALPCPACHQRHSQQVTLLLPPWSPRRWGPCWPSPRSSPAAGACCGAGSSPLSSPSQTCWQSCECGPCLAGC